MTYAKNEDVHESVDIGAFEVRHPAVLHQLRVFSSVDDHPETPFRVAKNAAYNRTNVCNRTRKKSKSQIPRSNIFSLSSA